MSQKKFCGSLTKNGTDLDRDLDEDQAPDPAFSSVADNMPTKYKFF
jgi:hypothetical protein